MATKLGSTTISKLYFGSTEITKAYLGSTEVYSSGGAFSPASLFASSEEGAWYDPSDLTTLWTDTAGTTQATVGDAVARMDDKSGNGNHMTQATAAARPILRQSGSLYYLEHDRVDDYFIYSNFIVDNDTVTYAESYSPDGSNWMLYNRKAQQQGWCGIGEAGSTSTSLTDSGNQIKIRFDGSEDTSGTRGGQFTSSQGANVVLQEMIITKDDWDQNADLQWGKYGDGGFGFYSIGDKCFGIVSINRALTTQETSDLEDYLAAKAGVTL